MFNVRVQLLLHSCAEDDHDVVISRSRLAFNELLMILIGWFSGKAKAWILVHLIDFLGIGRDFNG